VTAVPAGVSTDGTSVAPAGEEGPGWWATSPVGAEQANAWVAKARAYAAPLIKSAGPVGDPAPVRAVRVDDSDEWIYGNFMLAWLEPAAQPREVHHLPDGAFFLQLLRQAYRPVLDRRPDLTPLLSDTSRSEMSLTNDVLQIQLHGLDAGYSMIRHHALMLFHAALWLDEPRRTQWLGLYDALVGHLDHRPAGRPDIAELAHVEDAAFADFAALAPRTLTPGDAHALLRDEHRLRAVLDYQLYAGAAIGLLWREFRRLPDHRRGAWQREQLGELYLRPDYLAHNWMDAS
jgi:hypothetical protein